MPGLKVVRFLFAVAATWLAALACAHAAPHGAPESQPPASAGGRVITGSEDYVAISPIVASIQTDFSMKGILHIELGLNAERAALRRRIQARMHHLRDAYTAAIMGYTGLSYEYGDVPDAQRISEMLQAATDRTLGEQGATVLLGMVIIYDQE